MANADDPQSFEAYMLSRFCALFGTDDVSEAYCRAQAVVYAQQLISRTIADHLPHLAARPDAGAEK